MAFSLPKASVVVPTHNNKAVLERVLKAMLKLDYPNEFEIIVVDDGSTDSTREMLKQKFGKEKKIKTVFFTKNHGVCRARNAGIAKALYPLVVNMDHDCIPEKGWLKGLAKEFSDEKVGVVSSFGDFGGTSTAFRKELVKKVKGYDERFFYYREDTDLTFSIMELGYDYRLVKMQYFHDHTEIVPKGLVSAMKYVFKRLKYHMNDALLFKKHKGLATEFLDVKLGFIVNPKKDFQAVTGTWLGPHDLVLSSPRGIHFVENKSLAHATFIVLAGIAYAAAVKVSRLAGSLKFGTLLV